MSTDIRPYQHLAIDFMASHPRCSIFAGMGLGKTLASLFQVLNRRHYPILVIAPKRVAQSTWVDEAHKWYETRGLTITPLMAQNSKRFSLLAKPSHIYTINYDSIPWLVTVLGNAWPFKYVICDESTRLKNYRLHRGDIKTMSRSQTLARIARQTDYWINLTGTPAANGLQDLWGPQWFIDYGLALGVSYNAFFQRWFYRPGDFRTRPIAKPHARDEIMSRLAPTTLSIDANDWFDIDQPIVTRVEVEMPDRVRAQYRKMARELYLNLANGEQLTAFNAAAKTQKLCQIASGGVYYENAVGERVTEWLHDEKLEALQEIADDWFGEPLLVVYTYAFEYERIKKRFPHAKNAAKKDDRDAWNRGEVAMLLIHPDSAGHGLNLQYGGNKVVFFSHTWKLEGYLQVLERIGPVRQLQAGFNRPVFVYHIVAKGTMDDVIIDRTADKKDVVQSVIDNLRGMDL